MIAASVDLEYAYFQKKVLELVGIDLTSYKSEQMRRRLNALLARNGIANLFEYYRLIQKDDLKRREFRDFVTINVSEFFRIPERFEYLRRQLLPGLLAARRQLRVWSAGCSDGAEPYSLAIALRELAPAGRWTVLATDVDRTVLDRASHGVYAVEMLRNVDSVLLKKHFIPKDGGFRVNDLIKGRVQFRQHDLLRDEYEKDFDLIVCRHVLIYFTEEAKTEVVRCFRQSLRPGGVLFVGGTEALHHHVSLGYEAAGTSFYRYPVNPIGRY